MGISSETVDTRRSDLVPFEHYKNESYTQQKYPLGKKEEVKKFSDEGKRSHDPQIHFNKWLKESL